MGKRPLACTRLTLISLCFVARPHAATSFCIVAVALASLSRAAAVVSSAWGFTVRWYLLWSSPSVFVHSLTLTHCTDCHSFLTHPHTYQYTTSNTPHNHLISTLPSTCVSSRSSSRALLSSLPPSRSPPSTPTRLLVLRLASPTPSPTLPRTRL